VLRLVFLQRIEWKKSDKIHNCRSTVETKCVPGGWLCANDERGIPIQAEPSRQLDGPGRANSLIRAGLSGICRVLILRGSVSWRSGAIE
jgi:hypothetical protein